MIQLSYYFIDNSKIMDKESIVKNKMKNEKEKVICARKNYYVVVS